MLEPKRTIILRFTASAFRKIPGATLPPQLATLQLHCRMRSRIREIRALGSPIESCCIHFLQVKLSNHQQSATRPTASTAGLSVQLRGSRAACSRLKTRTTKTHCEPHGLFSGLCIHNSQLPRNWISRRHCGRNCRRRCRRRRLLSFCLLFLPPPSFLVQPSMRGFFR